MIYVRSIHLRTILLALKYTIPFVVVMGKITAILVTPIWRAYPATLRELVINIKISLWDELSVLLGFR